MFIIGKGYFIATNTSVLFCVIKDAGFPDHYLISFDFIDHYFKITISLKTFRLN